MYIEISLLDREPGEVLTRCRTDQPELAQIVDMDRWRSRASGENKAAIALQRCGPIEIVPLLPALARTTTCLRTGNGIAASCAGVVPTLPLPDSHSVTDVLPMLIVIADSLSLKMVPRARTNSGAPPPRRECAENED